jgi:hypothetical protein
MSNGDSDSEGVGSGSGGGGDPNVTEESPYLPTMHPEPSVPHYYGDYVRQIFLLCGAIMLVFAPFLSKTAPGALPIEIGGALLVAILGALTNPMRQISMVANSIVAAVGVVTYELLAINAYYSGAMLAFIEREILALAFLFALYFSLKTLRNMMHRLIGKRTKFGDFVDGSH